MCHFAGKKAKLCGDKGVILEKKQNRLVTFTAYTFFTKERKRSKKKENTTTIFKISRWN